MQDIIIAIIAALSGGGLTGMFVIPYTRKKAKAEAERSVVDNYETYTTRIEKRLEALESEVEKLKIENARQFEIIMTGFRCPLLQAHPSESCPVQEAYAKSREGGADA